jgi:RimJ/RimL family protein N-acetyltransferase
MEQQPTLDDGVVRLTAFSLRDVDPLVNANRDPDMALRFDFPRGPPDPAAARAAIRRWQRGWRTRRLVAFAVRDTSSMRLIGGCELRMKADGIANVSYFTVPAERGRGIATRAVRLASAFAFQQLGVERLEIKAETDNVASRTVAERAGYMFEGILRAAGSYRRGRRDLTLYSRLRTETEGASG